MKIAVFYINAGKGHFIPSVAICENLMKMGHDAVAFDFFKLVEREDVAKVASDWWRYMLKHPNLERHLEVHMDKWRIVRWGTLHEAKKVLGVFEKWLDDFQPDMILTTQYSCSYVVPEMLKILGRNICCCAYSPDTYVTPKTGLNDKQYRVFIASEEGKQLLIKDGQAEDRIELCAFPLRNDCYNYPQLSKSEARAKLGLKNMFTVLLNLGGEGIASTAIVDTLIRQHAGIQILVVGTLSDETRAHYEEIRKQYPDAELVLAGYVNEMNLWLCACDMLVGKAGPNAMTEALYCRRPYMVTQLLYMSDKVVGYFIKYGVGWYAHKVKDQIDIIMKSKNDPEFLTRMEANFDKVPMKFGADKFAKQLVETCERYYKEYPGKH